MITHCIILGPRRNALSGTVKPVQGNTMFNGLIFELPTKLICTITLVGGPNFLFLHLRSYRLRASGADDALPGTANCTLLAKLSFRTLKDGAFTVSCPGAFSLKASLRVGLQLTPLVR